MNRRADLDPACIASLCIGDPGLEPLGRQNSAVEATGKDPVCLESERLHLDAHRGGLHVPGSAAAGHQYYERAEEEDSQVPAPARGHAGETREQVAQLPEHGQAHDHDGAILD